MPMCPVAPAHASWLRAVRSRHVPRGSSSLLPAQVSSIAATCPVAPALTSCLRAAPGPLRVLRGSIGCEPLKKINIPWQRDHHDLYRGARVSFNALRDKGGAARLQSMQQVAH
jgi:hypothetical protein